MASDVSLTLIFIIIGFITLVLLTFAVIMFVAFRRRKLIFCRFLDMTGKWEIYKTYKIDKSFDYDGCTYKYDIKLCTRDVLNRPIASYYKNNPEQMTFNYEKHDKLIKVGTQEMSGKDVRQLILTKIIKDIFADEVNFQLWFIILLIVSILGFAIIGFMIGSADNICVLAPDNSTLATIEMGVKQAIGGV